MDVTGAVQSRVAALTRRHMGGSLPPRVRHGTAEQGAWPRRRSRGRNESSLRPVTGRTRPVGPEEEHAWMQALKATNDRIDTLERLQRMSAQTTNHFDESLRGFHSCIAEVCSDITDFRTSVSTAHCNMDRVLTDRLANLQSQIDALTGVLSSMPAP